MPVRLVAEQKSDEHAGIHFAEGQAAQAARVARRELFGGVGGGVGAVREGEAGGVRVEVEEGGGLGADEVVGLGGAAAVRDGGG